MFINVGVQIGCSLMWTMDDQLPIIDYSKEIKKLAVHKHNFGSFNLRIHEVILCSFTFVFELFTFYIFSKRCQFESNH